ESFVKFVDGILENGVLIACADDPGVQRLLSKVHGSSLRVVTYGIGSFDSVIHASEVQQSDGMQSWEVTRNSNGGRETLGVLTLRVPGKHSALNALAAVAAGFEAGVRFEVIAWALAEFT